MYEPVADRCLTAVVARPSKCNSKIYSRSFDSEKSYFDADDRMCPPEKPPRRHKRQMSHQDVLEGGPKNKMRTTSTNHQHCVDVDQVHIDSNVQTNNYKNKFVDASAQTSHLVPYRLRFWPRCSSDVKLGPDETSCGLRARCCCRAVSQWILSQVGLTFVVIVWALLGAYAFFKTEGPREQGQTARLAKLQKELSVELATDLKKTVDDQDTWPAIIHKYFERHEVLFLEAVGAGFGEGGGGNIWTYPGCLLFAVSLLTTLGFGAPVPRTPLGRGAAVLFASVGIPLHFLLVLNMGNLAAIRLQQFAFRNRSTEVPASPQPRWLKLFPLMVIIFYYVLGVVLFGVVRQRDVANCFMFPLDFTAAGGVATVEGHVRILYALYLEVAVTLAALVVSLLQASATRGIVDVGLRLGLLTNT